MWLGEALRAVGVDEALRALAAVTAPRQHPGRPILTRPLLDLVSNEGHGQLDNQLAQGVVVRQLSAEGSDLCR